MITLFCPVRGELRVKGVISTANKVLHPWLEEQLEEILAVLPPPLPKSSAENKALWEKWQAGLSRAPALGEDLPALRLLLVHDNLSGHCTPTYIIWLCEQGIMPLFTPLALGGSWLNMAESIQHIIINRALGGTYPKEPQEIIGWLEETAQGWNAAPTKFEWDGKRKARRDRARQRQSCHPLAKSGAYTQAPVPLHLSGEPHKLSA